MTDEESEVSSYSNQNLWNDVVDAPMSLAKSNSVNDEWTIYIRGLKLDCFDTYADKTSLTIQEKQVLRLLYINKLKHREVAQIIGISTGYVGTLRNKAIRKLMHPKNRRLVTDEL
jgi:DNA-directed RNA polymerase specialized sigma24 family protein